MIKCILKFAGTYSMSSTNISCVLNFTDSDISRREMCSLKILSAKNKIMYLYNKFILCDNKSRCYYRYTSSRVAAYVKLICVQTMKKKKKKLVKYLIHE